MQIIDHMKSVIEKPRSDISKYAPQIKSIKVDPDKIGIIIGPGGKMIRSIVEDTGAKIDILDEGEVLISGTDFETISAAEKRIIELVKDIEVDDIYDGKVVKITGFGAFIEVLPGKEGLLHISQITESRLNAVEDVLSVGDPIKVKVVGVDGNTGKFNLTAKSIS